MDVLDHDAATSADAAIQIRGRGQERGDAEGRGAVRRRVCGVADGDREVVEVGWAVGDGGSTGVLQREVVGDDVVDAEGELSEVVGDNETVSLQI